MVELPGIYLGCNRIVLLINAYLLSGFGVLGIDISGLDLVSLLNSEKELVVIETLACQTDHVVTMERGLAVQFYGKVTLCGLKTHVLVSVQDYGVGINLLNQCGGVIILAVCGKKQCQYQRNSNQISFHNSK